jgi:hypothetical protein
MSLAIPSPSVSVPDPLDPKRDWTTPEVQLNRLISPTIATEISESSPLFPDLAKVVAVYMIEEEGDWYIALERLKSRLPEKITIPPLPSKIYDILKNIPEDIDFHRLSLVLEEFGCLDNLEKNILNPYVQEVYAGQEDPLHFQNLITGNSEQYLAAPFPKTHWILTSVLSHSINKCWVKQKQLVESLRNKTSENYETASLQPIFVANITHVLATGETLFPSEYYMWLKEMPSEELLRVSFRSSGVYCENAYGQFSCRYNRIGGSVVVRKL